MNEHPILLVVFLLCSFCRLMSQSCLADGIVFSRQEQIDSFPIQYSGCVHIVGDLKVKEAMPKTIRNLEALSQIRSIGGDLIIWNNHSLMNLQGLNGLEFIGGNLALSSNDTLFNLGGLDKLRKIGGGLLVKSNKNLNDFSGAIKLDSIQGDLGIVKNDSLESLKGFENLFVVGGNLILRDNSSLKNLEGLEKLISVNGNVSVREHIYITSLKGLDNLHSIGGFLDVSHNSSLKNLIGLNNLTFIGADLRVEHNASLESLSGLEKLKNIRGVTDVHDNPLLGNIDELDQLGLNKEIRPRVGRKGTYKIWVSTIEKSLKHTGYLTELYDSSIVVSNFLSSSNPAYQTKRIDVLKIETLKLRRQNSVGNGILIGVLSGFALGGILGLISGTAPCPPGSFFCFTPVQVAFLTGTPLAAVGAIVGGISGSGMISIPINQDHRKYTRVKRELMEYQVGAK